MHSGYIGSSQWQVGLTLASAELAVTSQISYAPQALRGSALIRLSIDFFRHQLTLID